MIGAAETLSARLEKQAAPWQILMSRSTMDELGGRFSVKAVGEIKVKDKTVPVQVYEVLWKEAVRMAPRRPTCRANPEYESLSRRGEP